MRIMKNKPIYKRETKFVLLVSLVPMIILGILIAVRGPINHNYVPTLVGMYMISCLLGFTGIIVYDIYIKLTGKNKSCFTGVDPPWRYYDKK